MGASALRSSHVHVGSHVLGIEELVKVASRLRSAKGEACSFPNHIENAVWALDPMLAVHELTNPSPVTFKNLSACL